MYYICEEICAKRKTYLRELSTCRYCTSATCLKDKITGIEPAPAIPPLVILLILLTLEP